MNNFNSDNKTNNKKLWLRILFCVFLFPIAITVYIVKNKKMKKVTKGAVISLVWMLFLALAAFSTSSNNKEATDTTSKAVVSKGEGEEYRSNDAENDESSYVVDKSGDADKEPEGQGTNNGEATNESAGQQQGNEDEKSSSEYTGDNQADRDLHQETVQEKVETKKQTVSSKPKGTKKVNNPNSNGKAVYSTPYGKKYHYDPDCGGKNSKKTTLEEAKRMGLTPCKKCVH